MESDWPEVARIYQDGLDTGVASFEIEVPPWDEWDARMRPELRLVAELRGRIVGWIAIATTSRRTCYRGVVEHSIYVDEAARGQGVGRALLERLVSEAPAYGVWTIQTSILPTNAPSLGLHAAVGFRRIGIRERIAQRNGRWQDSVLLELRLPDADTVEHGV